MILINRVIIFLISIFSLTVKADHYTCRATYDFEKNEYFFVELKTETVEECMARVESKLLQQVQRIKSCQRAENEILLKIKASKREHTYNVPAKKIKCQDLRDVASTAEVAKTLPSALKSLENEEEFDAFVGLENKGCDEQRLQQVVGIKSITTTVTEEELKTILGGSYKAGEELDKLVGTSVYFGVRNDAFLYNGLNGPLKMENDDVGLTHGMDLIIKQKVGDKYTISVVLMHELYNQHINGPNNIKREKDEAGVMREHINFMDETKFKILVDNRDAEQDEYWVVGGGIHAVNQEKMDRNFLVSGVRTQNHLHEGKLETVFNTSKYQYYALPRNEEGVILHAAVGTDKDLYTGTSSRLHSNTEAAVELSTLQGGSRVGVSQSLTYDIQKYGGNVFRTSLGGTVHYYPEKAPGSNIPYKENEYRERKGDKITTTPHMKIQYGNKNISGGFKIFRVYGSSSFHQPTPGHTLDTSEVIYEMFIECKELCF